MASFNKRVSLSISWNKSSIIGSSSIVDAKGGVGGLVEVSDKVSSLGLLSFSSGLGGFSPLLLSAFFFPFSFPFLLPLLLLLFGGPLPL